MHSSKLLSSSKHNWTCKLLELFRIQKHIDINIPKTQHQNSLIQIGLLSHGYPQVYWLKYKNIYGTK